MAIVAIKESKLKWTLSVSAAACESCADQAAGQDSQLGISSSFYTLSPFCSPSAVSQLFLTTDINLAGLLFPALSSDPLFFACPGWVQLNWFFFCFHFVFSPFVSEVPCTFLPAPSALLWAASIHVWLWLGHCKLSFDTRALGLNFPCTPAQIAYMLLGCLLHCVHVCKSHVTLTSPTYREKGVKLVWRARRRDSGWKQASVPDNSPLEVGSALSMQSGFSGLWGWRERVMGHIHYQSCLILRRNVGTNHFAGTLMQGQTSIKHFVGRRDKF